MAMPSPTSRFGDHPPAQLPQAACGEARCMCGSLLARLVPEGVELKCRRCKRTMVLPLEAPPTS